MSRAARRARAAAAGAAVLLLAAACGRDDEPGTSPSDGSATSGTTSATSPTAAAGATPSPAASVRPVPPGAEGWPVQDVASCADVTPATGPGLVIRVPVATGACLSAGTDVIVVVAGEADLDDGTGRAVDVPGFAGEVRAVGEQISRFVTWIAERADGAGTYVVLAQGGDRPPTQLLREVLVG